MKFNDPFNPGDTLKIDTDAANVLLNNQEVYDFSGNLFLIKPNTTTISYTDSEASRDLELTMEFQERYE